MRISDWSSDVCSSDLDLETEWYREAGLSGQSPSASTDERECARVSAQPCRLSRSARSARLSRRILDHHERVGKGPRSTRRSRGDRPHARPCAHERSEEHTSELQSLMRISYAVFCLKKKKKK